MNAEFALWLKQRWCGLIHGHAHSLGVFDRENDKPAWYLYCTNCGHRSPGWELPVTQAPGLTAAQVEAEIAALYADLMDVELQLGWGG